MNSDSIIPAEEIEELYEHFKLFDKSGSGKIKTEDLDKVLKRIGENLSPNDLSALTRNIDPTGNGSILFDTFVKGITPRLQQATLKESLIDAFQVFDKENTGYISASELMIIFSNLLDDLKLAPMQIAMLVRIADTDGDGQINYGEFVEMLLNTIFSNETTQP